MGSFISKKGEFVGYYPSSNWKDVKIYQIKRNNKWLVYSDDGISVHEFNRIF